MSVPRKFRSQMTDEERAELNATQCWYSVGAAARIVVQRLRPVVEYGALLEPLCESPIEILFGARFLATVECRLGKPREAYGDETLLIPQYPWQRYRIDFALFVPGRPAFFIECDGHDFHAATVEQIERDRRRDAEIQAAGIRVTRFTGSEINQSPEACVLAVCEAVRKAKA
jgi:hypothetical protein